MTATVNGITKPVNVPQLIRELGAGLLAQTVDGVTSVTCPDETITQATLQAAVDAHVAVDEDANGTTLRDQAVQAMNVNRTFLALASPTNAQTLAQVKALTRQNQALIRLVAGRLDGLD